MFFTNSFSLRNFAASILGVIIPYWFAAGFFVYTNNIDYLIAHFASFIDFHTLFDYSMITVHQLVNLSFITLLAVTGLTHREAYKDIFAITCIKTLAVFVVIGVFYATGIV